MRMGMAVALLFAMVVNVGMAVNRAVGMDMLVLKRLVMTMNVLFLGLARFIAAAFLAH